MRVIVLGAGVVGTATAWYLARAGHEVTVVERQGAAGLETSFANGGQISASHAEPWANPGAPAKIVEWLGREDAPLLFRPRADWRQWAWGARFLAECLPFRDARQHPPDPRARAVQPGRAPAAPPRHRHRVRPADARHPRTSTPTRRSSSAPRAQAELMRQYGCELRREDGGGSASRSSRRSRHAADRHRRRHLHRRPTSRATRASSPRGSRGSPPGRASGSTTAARSSGSRPQRGRIVSVVLADAEGRDDRISADAYVVALGSYSPLLLRAARDLDPGLSAQGLLDHRAARARRRGAHGEPHRRRATSWSSRGSATGCASPAPRRSTATTPTSTTSAARRSCGAPSSSFRARGVPSAPSSGPACGRRRRPTCRRRPHALPEPLPEHRPRHARLDDGVRLGPAIADIVSGRQPEPDFRFAGLPARARSVLVAKPAGCAAAAAARRSGSRASLRFGRGRSRGTSCRTSPRGRKAPPGRRPAARARGVVARVVADVRVEGDAAELRPGVDRDVRLGEHDRQPVDRRRRRTGGTGRRGR